MLGKVRQSLTLFYYYAHEDRQFLDEIDEYLTTLKKHCHIDQSFRGTYFPDSKQEEQLLQSMKRADLVILLISAYFSPSEYLRADAAKSEVKRRQWLGKQRIIAILLNEHADKNIPLVAQDILPTNATPLKEWANQELAFQNIERGLATAIETLWLTRGEMLLQETGDPERALEAFGEVLRLNPSNKLAWYGQGNAFANLDAPLYEEALFAFEEALRLDPAFSKAWYMKGGMLAGLRRDEDALHAYDEALHLDPTNMHIWHWKGEVLKALKRKKEAQQAQKKARQLGWPL